MYDYDRFMFRIYLLDILSLLLMCCAMFYAYDVNSTINPTFYYELLNKVYRTTSIDQSNICVLVNGMESCSSILIFFQQQQCFIFDPIWRKRGIPFVSAITNADTKNTAQSTIAAAASFLSNPFSETIATQAKQQETQEV